MPKLFFAYSLNTFLTMKLVIVVDLLVEAIHAKVISESARV